MENYREKILRLLDNYTKAGDDWEQALLSGAPEIIDAETALSIASWLETEAPNDWNGHALASDIRDAVGEEPEPNLGPSKQEWEALVADNARLQVENKTLADFIQHEIDTDCCRSGGFGEGGVCAQPCQECDDRRDVLKAAKAEAKHTPGGIVIECANAPRCEMLYRATSRAAEVERLQVELAAAVEAVRHVEAANGRLIVAAGIQEAVKVQLADALRKCSNRLLEESIEAGWPLGELKDVSPGTKVYAAWGIILEARAALAAAGR